MTFSPAVWLACPRNQRRWQSFRASSVRTLTLLVYDIHVNTFFKKRDKFNLDV